MEPRLLGEDDRAQMEVRLAQQRAPCAERALSDYTFDNLYLFRAAHGYSPVPGPHPAIAGRTYDGTAHLLPLFDIAATPIELLRELLGERECFYPVPAAVVAQLDPEQFEIEASRNDSDYLYTAQSFIEYEGKSLRGQRGAADRLRQNHRIRQEDFGTGRAADALHVLARWSAEKGLPDDAADGLPCREALERRAAGSRLSGSLWYVDDAAAGFLLTQALNPGVLAVRFAKGLREFDGIYPLMFQDLCRRHRDTVRWLNFEQDMGRANFRKAKLAYAPYALLEKFRVRPRGGK